MVYVGSRDNAPYVKTEAPNERILRILLSPELDPTNKDIAVGMTELKVGAHSDFRAHEEGELFFCIKGHGHVLVGDENIELKPYTTVWVPGGIPHQLLNDVGNEDMEILWINLAPFGGDRLVLSMWKEQQEKNKL